MALFPAQGTTRNDMGAHGGPGSQPFPAIDLSGVHPQNQLELSMQAFPNPASDYLQLVLNQTLDQAVQVSLVNLVGQTILEKTIPPTHTSLEIDLKEKNISPGVHFLIVSSKDQVPIIMKVLVADR